MADKPVIVAERIIFDNKPLINEALALMSQSRQRAMNKVRNPVIVRELQVELDKLAELRRAINTL